MKQKEDNKSSLGKIGFACGVFDIFHIGHALMLRECKEHCDYLVVGLNKAENIDPAINPGKNKPVFSVKERKVVLESCRYVDEVLEYDGEEDLYLLLASGRFAIRFLGDDYRGKTITGEELKIPIHYLDRSHGWSTSKLKTLI